MMIHQLPAATSIADADMIPLDTGTVNKYIPAENLLSQQKMITIANTQGITTSVDALTVGRAYHFIINSGNQQVAGLPTNRTFSGIAFCPNSTMKEIILYSGSGDEVWIKRKASGTWGGWKLISGEIAGTITRNAIMNTSDTIKVVQHGGMATFQMSCRIITAGTYDASTVLCTSSIVPVSTFSGVMLHGSNHTIVRITSSGDVTFNSSTTVAANNYLIGQITFPVKEA